jgi:hypothetical protein
MYNHLTKVVVTRLVTFENGQPVETVHIREMQEGECDNGPVHRSTDDVLQGLQRVQTTYGTETRAGNVAASSSWCLLKGGDAAVTPTVPTDAGCPDDASRPAHASDGCTGRNAYPSLTGAVYAVSYPHGNYR